MYNVDARLNVDTDRAFGWTGGRFVLEGFYESQNSLGQHYVGAVDQQIPKILDGFAMYRLYQVYYDQNFGATDVLFGIYDLETEFSVTKPMSLFLSKNLTWNTALDQSGTMPQNGTVGPGNYPYTPLALRIRETIRQPVGRSGRDCRRCCGQSKPPSTERHILLSQYGALGMGEIDYTPNPHTKAMAGLWGLTSKLPTNDLKNPNGMPREVYGEEGGYVGGATRLYSQGGRRGLDAFFTLGFSSQLSTNTS